MTIWSSEFLHSVFSPSLFVIVLVLAMFQPITVKFWPATYNWQAEIIIEKVGELLSCVEARV